MAASIQASAQRAKLLRWWGVINSFTLPLQQSSDLYCPLYINKMLGQNMLSQVHGRPCLHRWSTCEVFTALSEGIEEDSLLTPKLHASCVAYCVSN